GEAAEQAVPTPRAVTPAESGAAPAVETLACPNCGGVIEIKAAGYTVSIACQYCGSVLDVSQPQVQIVQRYEQEAAKLELPLGSRGTLRGVEWEVIGYQRRSENGAYPWDEYLLFNPYHGYRFLDTDGRGWTLGRQLTADPASGGVFGLSLDGQFYEPFYAETESQTDYVLGEFYWQARVGDAAITADYVRPGHMLSYERTREEVVWTLGELLGPREVTDAFGIPPRPKGGTPLPHEPSPHRATAGMVGKFALLAIGALILISFLFGGTSNPESTTISLATDEREQSATIGPVELDRPYQAVTVTARAPGIDNSWVDLSYALVDRETGDTYEANNVVEAYSGTDSEGSWSEGSRASSSKFSMVPAGTYDLEVSAAGSQWLEAQYAASQSADVEVTIAKGATFWSNFILALLLVGIPAIWIWWRHLSFESRRKADSDFASSGEDDEEDEDDSGGSDD
ncbi:MAG: DUF4178 domain-containing protein, partial [Sphingomonadaceae bacterium]|nr:DUF4178 domain-containing protein [Sphingomonadaceae bacterium]